MSEKPEFPGFPKPEPSAFPESQTCYGGMTLRDWFAGKALAHALAYERSLIDRYDGPKAMIDHMERATERAYRIADAMLIARERK